MRVEGELDIEGGGVEILRKWKRRWRERGDRFPTFVFVVVFWHPLSRPVLNSFDQIYRVDVRWGKSVMEFLVSSTFPFLFWGSVYKKSTVKIGFKNGKNKFLHYLSFTSQWTLFCFNHLYLLIKPIMRELTKNDKYSFVLRRRFCYCRYYRHWMGIINETLSVIVKCI